MSRSIPLVLFGLLLFLVTVDQFCILPLLPAIKRDLNLTGLEVALLVAAYHVASGVFGLFIAPRYATRKAQFAFVAGITVFVFANAAVILADSLWLLITLRAATGLGASAIGYGVMLITRTLPSPEARRRAHGRSTIGTLLALVAGPLLYALITRDFGWRWPFAFVAVLAAPAIPIAGVAARGLSAAAKPARARPKYGALLQPGRPAMGVMIMFLFTGATGGLMALFGLWLATGPGAFDVFPIAKVYTAGGIGVLAGGALGGRFVAFVGARAVVIACSLALIFCFMVIASTPRTEEIAFLTFFFLTLLESTRRGPLQGTLVHFVPSPWMPSYTMLKNGAGQAGIAMIVPAMAMLLDTGRSISMPCALAITLTVLGVLGFSAARNPSPPTE